LRSRDAFVPVEHGDDDLSLLDRLQCLDNTKFFDDLVHFRATPYPSSVDKYVLAIIALERNRNAIARRAGLVKDNEAVFTDQTINEGRLADIGAADDRDTQLVNLSVILFVGLLRDFEVGENRIHQCTDSVAMGGRHGMRVSNAKAMELARCKVGVETFGLVDRQPYLARVPACQVCDVLVGGSQPLASINHDDRCVRFPEGTHGLLNHALIDPDFTAGDTTGVDGEVRNCAQLAETILAVSCQARVVSNQCVT
jgi:hypothetical protein